MKKVSALISSTALFLASASFAFADTPLTPCPKGTANNGFDKLCNSDINFGNVISTSITIILVFAVLLSLFFLIYGGIRWILSGGDKGKVDEARKTIVAAIIGLIVAFVSFFILNTVLHVFGLGDVNNLTLPTLGI